MGQNETTLREQVIHKDGGSNYNDVSPETKNNEAFISREEMDNREFSKVDETSALLNREDTQPKGITQFLTTQLEDVSQFSNLSGPEVTVVDETSLEYDFDDNMEESACRSIQARPTKNTQKQMPMAQNFFSEIRNKVSQERFKASQSKLEEDAGVSKLPNVKELPSPSHLRRPAQQEEFELGYKCLTCNRLFLSKICFELHSNTHGQNRSGYTTISQTATLKDPKKEVMFATYVKRSDVSKGSSKETENKEESPAATGVYRLRSSRIPKQSADPNSKKKVFWCQTCKKRFSNFVVFLKHKQGHPQESPKTCLYCDKTFSLPSQLKRHVMIHTGEKPYVCVTCHKPYRLLDSLRRHARKCVSD